MRKLLHICIFLAFFISCKKERNYFFTEKNSSKIDSLFLVSENKGLKKEERIASSKIIYDHIFREPVSFLNVNDRLRLANIYYYLEDYDKYFKIHNELLKFSVLTKSEYVGIKANYGLGVYYLIKFSNDSAFFHFSKAEKISKGSNEKFYLEEISENKANLLFINKDYSGSEIAAVNALRFALKNANHRIIYDSYISIGNSLGGINDFKKAVGYYERAISKTEDLREDPQYFSLKAQPYNYIGKICQKNGNYKDALKYADSALSFENYRKIDPVIFCYLTNNRAYSKYKLGDYHCFDLFNETLKIGDSLHNIPVQLTSKLYLSEYYLSKKDITSAKRHADEARDMAHENKVFEDELKALDLLSKIDSSNNSKYNKRYIALSDSLQNVERATRNKFARIEFETDEITNEKNTAEAEKEKLSAQRWMILGFSLFFIVLLVLFYVSRLQHAKNRELRYLQKQQQANAEIYQLMLDQQQKIEEGKQIEQRRISKELHDGIMGKLTAIRLNLFVLSKKTDSETITRCLERIDEIQDVEKEIRKISHDLSQNLFADVSDFTSMVTNLIDAAKEHSQLQFKLIADEKIDWNSIHSVVKMQVYRILQESLHNIQKYAKAKSVCIRINQKDCFLMVSVSDDGVGFDARTIKPGIGHRNMRERAAEINGELVIRSEIGKGTQINLTIST